MEVQILGYYGLNCDACPVFIAKANNDDKLRQETALEWSDLYADYLGEDVLTKEDINCSGCRAKQSIFIGCRHCPIRSYRY